MKTLLVLAVLIASSSAFCPNATTRPPWITTRPPWIPTTQGPHVPPQNGSCNFDDRSCRGFLRQESNDDFDWTINRGNTPTYFTGPSGDHTYGYGRYIYTEAIKRKQGDRARLNAYLRTYHPACIHFYYHMYGSDMGTLRISVNHKLVWQLTGNQGNQWIRGTFPIHGAGSYALQIDGIIGPSYTSDMALDDIGYQEFYWMPREICMVTPSCANPNSKPQRPTTFPPFPATPTYPPWTNPPNAACGVSSISHQRVIGGQNAIPGAWPWQVGLNVLYSGSNLFICGGSLVSPEWVVTAAHCIVPFLRKNYTVVLGDNNRNYTEGSEQRIKVSQIFVHPNWNYSNIDSDIALMKLARPAMYTRYVKPVCLPQQDGYVPPHRKCFITGWGKIKHPGDSYAILQEARLSTIGRFECQMKLSADNTTSSRLKITENMICGGERGTIKSGCHGDSGGPFVCEENGRWVLQGAVSWGSPRCDARQRYTVFARVAKFRNWIDTLMRKN